MKIEMQKIDLKTNATINYVADVQKERDEAHHIYSLLYMYIFYYYLLMVTHYIHVNLKLKKNFSN